jgi:hypothetical protein
MTRQSSQTSPSQAVIKRLFAHSGNRCAFPKCTSPIVQETTIVGKICHIKAARLLGPRYDKEQSPEQRHGYDNLILLCANHHTTIDADPDAYTVERLIKMKADHEGTSAALTEEELDVGARLFIDQAVRSDNQSGGITAHTINQTFNVQPPLSQTEQEEQRNAERLLRQSEARRYLAPELNRTINRVLYIHSRAIPNFTCASVEHSIKPNDRKEDFIPSSPALYPHAPQCRDLAADDAVALIAFYDSLHSLTEFVNGWWEREGQLPENIFNMILHHADKSLELALICVEKFDLERLCPPPYEAWGTISSQIKRSLAIAANARKSHIERAQAKAVKAPPRPQRPRR